MEQQVMESFELVRTLVNKIAEFLVNYSFELVGALVILFLGVKISRWAARLVLKFLEKRKLDPTICRFTAAAVRAAILGFAIVVALGKFGITITPIVAAIGAVAFGGTLAIQGVLSNLGAGFSLLLFRPFRVGDTITVIGISGVVEEVTLGATTLTNEDGEKITVPNRHIVGEVLRNSFAYKVVESVVGISYGDDPERAITVLRSTLERVPEVAKTPAPIIGIQTFGESSIDIGLRYWVPTKQYFQISYTANLAIYKALKDANITIPFPQRDVHIVSQPG